MTVRSPVPTSMRTSIRGLRRTRARVPASVVTTKLPSALTSKSASRNAPPGAGSGRGTVGGRSTSNRCGSAGPEVVVPVPHRIAGVQHRRHLVVLAQRPAAACRRRVGRRRQHRRRDHGDVGRPRGAHRRRRRRAARAPRRPRRRRRAAATAPRAACRRPRSGRAATNSRSPSAVKAGDDSPLAPRVSRRAGRWPAGSSSQRALTYSVRLSLSSATVVTTREPSGDTARPATPAAARGRRRGRRRA